MERVVHPELYTGGNKIMNKMNFKRFHLTDIFIVFLVFYCLKAASGIDLSKKYHITDLINPVVVLTYLKLW